MKNITNDEERKIISTFIFDDYFHQKLENLNYHISMECNPIILLKKDTKKVIGTIEKYNYQDETLILESNNSDKLISLSFSNTSEKAFSYTISDKKTTIKFSSSNNEISIEKITFNNHIYMSFNNYQMLMDLFLENGREYELKIDPIYNKNIYLRVTEPNDDKFTICYKSDHEQDIESNIVMPTLVGNLIGREVNFNDTLDAVVHSKQVKSLVEYVTGELSNNNPRIEKVLSENFDINNYVKESSNYEDVKVIIRSFLNCKIPILESKEPNKVYRKK